MHFDSMSFFIRIGRPAQKIIEHSKNKIYIFHRVNPYITLRKTIGVNIYLYAHSFRLAIIL